MMLELVHNMMLELIHNNDAGAFVPSVKPGSQYDAGAYSQYDAGAYSQ